MILHHHPDLQDLLLMFTVCELQDLASLKWQKNLMASFQRNLENFEFQKFQPPEAAQLIPNSYLAPKLTSNYSTHFLR